MIDTASPEREHSLPDPITELLVGESLAAKGSLHEAINTYTRAAAGVIDLRNRGIATQQELMPLALGIHVDCLELRRVALARGKSSENLRSLCHDLANLRRDCYHLVDEPCDADDFMVNGLSYLVARSCGLAHLAMVNSDEGMQSEIHQLWCQEACYSLTAADAALAAGTVRSDEHGASNGEDRAAQRKRYRQADPELGKALVLSTTILDLGGLRDLELKDKWPKPRIAVPRYVNLGPNASAMIL